MNDQETAQRMIDAVKSVNLDAIEGARDAVNRSILEILLPEFEKLTDDYQRAAFAMLICDLMDPITLPVMRKVLSLPDTEDIFNIARATALDHLAGKFGTAPDWTRKEDLNRAVLEALRS
ncbi:MAG TPA: hypothetical protein PKC35_03385 [Leptospiraceae bacterium]|nr:hypothetical protein [Leptospiraceae bacterium]